MRFLLDENIPSRVLWWLIAEGHDATSSREVGLLGSSDQDMHAWVVREERVLITLDRDFCDPARFVAGPGRVVLRPGVVDAELIQELLAEVLCRAMPRPGQVCLVQPDGIALYRQTEG
jgi:predicted nuclease of predicted toxin-antitoxin system